MLGHPPGLFVLFFTELWERFSFYGMKTLLLLYMINHFFWSQEDASSLLGTYAMLAYGVPVIGGFIADRYLGARRAVVVGGVLLAIGHFLMAFEPLPFFYTALGFIIAGVGFLKPNISTQVGSLYPPGDPRRDGAFTIFYMGINLGAFSGPLLCDWLRVHYGYHYGFAAAGVGMVLGLIVYVIGQRRLVEFCQDSTTGGDEATGPGPAKVQREDGPPRRVVVDRVVVLLVVFAFVILFWTAFEQSANVLLVWADKHTNLRLASIEPPPVTLDDASGTTTAPSNETTGLGQQVGNWFRDPTMTSGQTQSFNPFFIITLAPIFAFLWVWLDRRGRQPSTPTKMVLGITLSAVAYVVMWPAAHSENRPSEARLDALPKCMHVDAEGRVYSVEDSGTNGAGQHVYYGATRLRYDAAGRKLIMSGVLPDLDRLRLLAETAPADFKRSVKSLVVDAEKKASEAERGEPWQTSVTLESVPPGFALSGTQVTEVVRWDAEAKTLIATGEIKERAEAELFAGAAPPEFKAAVDKIYLESAQFRVSVWWLVLFFLALTMGELCLSPVGLSLVTKLAPPRQVGMFMGGWFLATAVAEKLAQVFGGWWGKMEPMDYFVIFIVMCGVGGLLMALLIRPLKRMMHGVQ